MLFLGFPAVTPSCTAGSPTSVFSLKVSTSCEQSHPSPGGGAGHWSQAEGDEPRAVLGHLHISEQTHFQTKNPPCPAASPQPLQVPACCRAFQDDGAPSPPPAVGSQPLGWERQVLPGWICAAKLQSRALVPHTLGRRLRMLRSRRHVPKFWLCLARQDPRCLPGTPLPHRHKKGRVSGFATRPPSERRKRTQQSPINYWILFCNIGQIKRCRDPKPCVLWRGESFSSHAGAKHLSALPSTQRAGSSTGLSFPRASPCYRCSQLGAGLYGIHVCRHPASGRCAGVGAAACLGDGGISAGCW